MMTVPIFFGSILFYNRRSGIPLHNPRKSSTSKISSRVQEGEAIQLLVLDRHVFVLINLIAASFVLRSHHIASRTICGGNVVALGAPLPFLSRPSTPCTRG